MNIRLIVKINEGQIDWLAVISRKRRGKSELRFLWLYTCIDTLAVVKRPHELHSASKKHLSSTKCKQQIKSISIQVFYKTGKQTNANNVNILISLKIFLNAKLLKTFKKNIAIARLGWKMKKKMKFFEIEKKKKCNLGFTVILASDSKFDCRGRQYSTDVK